MTSGAWSSRPERQLWPQVEAYCQRDNPRHISMQAFDPAHGASRMSDAFSGDPAVTAKSSVVTESKRTVACAASLRWPPCHCRVPKSSWTAASRSRPGRSGPSQGFLPARERQRDLGVAQSHARKASRAEHILRRCEMHSNVETSRRFWFFVRKTKYNGGRGSSAVVLGTISLFLLLC